MFSITFNVDNISSNNKVNDDIKDTNVNSSNNA